MKSSTMEKAKQTNHYLLDSIKYLKQEDIVANSDIRLDLLNQLTKIQLKSEQYLKGGDNIKRIKQLAELEHTFERLTFLLDNISKGLTSMEHYYLLIIILIIALPYHSIAEEDNVWNYKGELEDRTNILDGFCETI